MKRLVMIAAMVLAVGCDSSGGDGGGSDTPPPGLDTEAPEAVAELVLQVDTPGAADLELVDDVEVPQPCTGEPVLRALSSDADETFDLGPYVMNVTRHSAVVMWRTLDTLGGQVIFREGADGEEITVVQDGTSTIHEIVLTGLSTDTSYIYRVESSGIASLEHEFMTAPVAGAPIRFIAWGDNQSGWEVFTEQIPLLLEDGPQLAVGVGDHVNSGKNAPDWKQQLFGPARPLFHQIPFFAAMGNHEGNADAYYELYSYPYPEGDPQHESYYSYTWGNTFFLVYDPYKLPCAFGGVETPESEWIKLAATSEEAKAATWRIAYAHEPAVSESWGDGSCHYIGNPCTLNGIMPLLAENGFHAHFSGHTHAWERGIVEGMVHMIVGGGGGHLDAWCEDLEPGADVVHTAHHHARVDAGCDTLRIEGVGLDGQVFDWVEIEAASPVVIVDEGPAEWIPAPALNSDRPGAE